MVNTTLSADKRLKDCQELFGGLKKKKEAFIIRESCTGGMGSLGWL